MAYQGQPLRIRPWCGAELQREGEQARLVGDLRNGGSRAADVPQRQVPRQMVLTLYGRDIARLDRFVAQGQRAALKVGREFEGVMVEVDADGSISINAIGMNSTRL